MSELFDIVTAVNRVKEQVFDLKKQIAELNKRIENICKYPALISFEKHVEEEIACKLLHISKRELLKMRVNGEITYTTHHRKILYPVASIQRYLAKHTIPSVPPFTKPPPEP